MQVPFKQLAALALVCLFASCGSNHHYKNKSTSSSADSATTEDIISAEAKSADTIDVTKNIKQVERKFIRTADLKFKVKNVIDATTQIENITKQFGGFVTYTNLNSNVQNVETTTVSEDSSLETKYYLTDNSITIRVPNIMLDTTIRTISSLIEYLDNRTIKADDVALNILANKFAINHATGGANRMMNAMNENNRSLNGTNNANESTKENQQEADNAYIDNLSMNDKIQYSTINLNIYQREAAQKEMISNNKNINAYQPSLGKRIISAMQFGWEILEQIIVFVFQIWAFILLFFIIYLIVKKYALFPNKKLDKKI